MIFNAAVYGAVAKKEPLVLSYSGNYTDTRDADGVGVVTLNTSGTLTVHSGEATANVYLLGGGGGGAQWPDAAGYSASGGGGGQQTVPVPIEPGTYEIVIGSGGNGVYTNGDGNKGGNGGSTSAFGFTSTGGGGGVMSGYSTQRAGGAGGSPNGVSGSTGGTQGGSPNGGRSNGNSASANSGGTGLVRLTFS